MFLLPLEKKLFLASFLIGFLFAVLTRFSYIASWSGDFYWNISLVPDNAASNFLHKPIGFTTTIAYDDKFLGFGFPFSAYAGCSMDFLGAHVGAVCNQRSVFSEFSILLNMIVWGGFSYGIGSLFAKKRNISTN